MPEKIGNAVDSAVATAEAVAAVPGKIADGVSWLLRVAPERPAEGPAAAPAAARAAPVGAAHPKEEVGPADGASSRRSRSMRRRRAAPVIDVGGLRPRRRVRGGPERMEAKERESSKKPAPTSYLDGP